MRIRGVETDLFLAMDSKGMLVIFKSYQSAFESHRKQRMVQMIKGRAGRWNWRRHRVYWTKAGPVYCLSVQVISPYIFHILPICPGGAIDCPYITSWSWCHDIMIVIKHSLSVHIISPYTSCILPVSNGPKCHFRAGSSRLPFDFYDHHDQYHLHQEVCSPWMARRT